MSRVVIIGCGGFGREVHDIIDAINEISPRWTLLGYLDDAPADANVSLVQARGSTVLDGSDWLLDAPGDVHYVIGVGSGSVRRAIDSRMTAASRTAATLIHPTVTVGYGVSIGDGSVLCAGVRVTNNIEIGRHVHVNLNSTIGHDSTLGDYVTVNPLVAISGGVVLGAEVMLGTHSAVLQNLTIGNRSVVGAGSCVVKAVPDDVVVKGVPAV